jgi:hypothetical protein
MTAIQYVEYVLDEDWTEGVSGRNNDVPKPELVVEAEKNKRSVDVYDTDIIFVRDGGVANYEPRSFGWAQEDQLSIVSLDIRTTGDMDIAGRERLWGERETRDTSPNYGGLVGEVKRIFDTIRKGDDCNYSMIRVTEANDLSGETGAGIWRATVQIELDARSVSIDP